MRAVGYPRVAVPAAIAVVVMAVVALIVIAIPILASTAIAAGWVALRRIGDAAGQADQGRCKCQQG